MKVKILQTQCGDWEGLFIDGRLIKEDHKINRMNLLELAEQYNFKSSDIVIEEINDEDEELMSIYGQFENTKLTGEYF